MKDIKTFLIGFLTCACLFLIMGLTPASKGGYQIAGTNAQLFMVDTNTGNLYILESLYGIGSWKKFVTKTF